jgi:hypothetical protein
VFNKYFHTVLCFEFANEPGVPKNTMNKKNGIKMVIKLPEFTCNAQVFTASHKSITFAGFGSGRNTRWVKVFLFSAGNSYQSAAVVKIHSNAIKRKK